MNHEKMMERLATRFQEKYEFRLARRNDIEAIMTYIDEAWRKGHRLSYDRELFEYEFCDGDDVHFLLAIDRETGAIEGMDGYYYTSGNREWKQFDVWGSMWSVRKDHKNLPMLGMVIADEYFKQVGFRYELGVGVNRQTATPLHMDYFEVATGTLNHYYILNQQDSYRIAGVNQYETFKPYEASDTYELKRFKNIQEVKASFDFKSQITTYPTKDDWYVNHRFFEHPVYDYQIYGLCAKDGCAEAIMVLKATECNGKKCMGIVDYMGDISPLKHVGNTLYNLMDRDTEFIDFFCYGYEEAEILKAGFTKVENEGGNIIPSHFAPYEQKNIEYWFNSDAKDNFVICKADADQDRPN